MSWKAAEHGVLLYLTTAAAHKRSRRQSAISNSRKLFQYAASPFQELELTRSTAGEKNPFTFNAFLLFETSQVKNFSLPVGNMYFSMMTFSGMTRRKKKNVLLLLLDSALEALFEQ